MQTVLKEKFMAYIQMFNPELLLRMNTEFQSTFIADRLSEVMPLVMQLLSEDKPGYIIEELALNEMTATLRPSRFHYIREILETEFSASHDQFAKAGVLKYECINLIEACGETFDTFSFSEENEDNRFLRYAIISKVHEYLN